MLKCLIKNKREPRSIALYCVTPTSETVKFTQNSTFNLIINYGNSICKGNEMYKWIYNLKPYFKPYF